MRNGFTQQLLGASKIHSVNNVTNSLFMLLLDAAVSNIRLDITILLIRQVSYYYNQMVRNINILVCDYVQNSLLLLNPAWSHGFFFYLHDVSSYAAISVFTIQLNSGAKIYVRTPAAVVDS